MVLTANDRSGAAGLVSGVLVGVVGVFRVGACDEPLV